jgi:murein L,D-transpeptidase YcbB/YkuD
LQPISNKTIVAVWLYFVATQPHPLRKINAMALTSTQLAGSPTLQKAAYNAPPVGYGAVNEGVAAMQRGLIDVGYPMPRSTANGAKPPDGIYGQETGKVLKQFQGDNYLTADGIAGKNTLGRLDDLLRSQSTYSAVAENAVLARELAGPSGGRPFAATTARRS